MSYRRIYLGNDNDPRPVYRDEEPEAFDWPEDAVMAVTFYRGNFPSFAWETYYGQTETNTEFYDFTGWPVDLAKRIRAAHGDEIRKELQVYPWAWRHWTDDVWARYAKRPTLCTRLRAQVSIADTFLANLPTPAT